MHIKVLLKPCYRLGVLVYALNLSTGIGCVARQYYIVRPCLKTSRNISPTCYNSFRMGQHVGRVQPRSLLTQLHWLPSRCHILPPLPSQVSSFFFRHINLYFHSTNCCECTVRWPLAIYKLVPLSPQWQCYRTVLLPQVPLYWLREWWNRAFVPTVKPSQISVSVDVLCWVLCRKGVMC